MKKRILAALLALAMAAGLICVAAPTASAAGEGAYDLVRLMDRADWRGATFARAGVEETGVISMRSIHIYSESGELLNAGVPSFLLWPNDCYYTDTRDVTIEEISRIVVSFTRTQGWRTTVVAAVFTKSDFEVRGTGGSGASKHVELSLTDSGKQVPDGHAVRFYAELNDETTYTLYDAIYVQHGQAIGDQMPSDPPVGSYEFLGWQTEPDGGDTVDANTHVVADLDVYASKGTAGEGHAQAYHVMSAADKRANALAVEVADHYNQQHGTDYGVESFTCTSIAVNGTDSSTNHLYSVNKWENQNEYYYVYNVGNPGGIDDLYNERVPVNEVQGITVYGEVDGDDYAQFIPVSELSLVETQNNVVVEIRVREKLDGITKELVASVQEVPAGLEPSDYSYPDGDRAVTIPADGSVTLLYKLTVHGDAGAAYSVTDEGAAAVQGALTGIMDSTREAVIYVTKTFTAADIVDHSLTNRAAVVPNDSTTLGAAEGENSDEAVVDAVEEGGTYAITGFAKELVDTYEERTAAEAVGIDTEGYAIPSILRGDKVLIPEGGSVTLLYAMTVTGSSGAGFTVTDAGAELVPADHVTITQGAGGDGAATFSGAIPPGETSVTFYLSRTFTADDLTGGQGKQVLTNSAAITTTAAGGVDPDADEATEEVPAEVDYNDLNGLDVQVGVFLDGDRQRVSDPQNYVTLSRVAEDPDYDDWYVTGPSNGAYTMDYDYNYGVGNGRSHVDILVDIIDDDRYVLQGISSCQTHGADGTRNVIDNGDGTYTIDNVTSSTTFLDVTIHLRTKYSVEYYQGSSRLTGEDYTDPTVYNAGEGVTGIDDTPLEDYPADPYDTKIMYWKNNGAYETAITLPGLPAVESDEYAAGWFLGSESGPRYDANTSVPVSTAVESLADGDHVIRFYATVADQTASDIQVEKELTSVIRDGSPLAGPFTDDTILLEGDVLTWTITVTNTGGEAVTGLQLSDALTVDPGDGEPRAVALTKDGAPFDAATETFALEAAGAEGGADTAAFTAVYTIQEADKGKTLSNSATVDDSDGSTTDSSGGTANPVGYTVSYDANGGSGSVAAQTAAAGGTVTVRANGFTRNDYTFQSWNTRADGTGAAYEPGDALTVSGDVTLYAQWTYSGGPVHPPIVTPPVDPGPRPDPTPDYAPYEPEGLNTEDHLAYLVGYEDGTVRPENDITRAEVATIFFRLLTDEVREEHWSTANPFSDVDGDDWFNTAVSTMSAMGIVDGYEDGTFRPDQPITRAEFVTIATRFFDYAAQYEPGTFTDVEGDEWYADFIQAGADLGLIDGYEDGSCRPGENITRAEAAAIVNRVLNRRPHEDHLLDEDVMNAWPDNPEEAWYYAHIQEATNTHDYDWVLENGETVEEWTGKLPDPDWDNLEQGLG